jgi:hypothetical protein
MRKGRDARKDMKKSLDEAGWGFAQPLVNECCLWRVNH